MSLYTVPWTDSLAWAVVLDGHRGVVHLSLWSQGDRERARAGYAFAVAGWDPAACGWGYKAQAEALDTIMGAHETELQTMGALEPLRRLRSQMQPERSAPLRDGVGRWRWRRA